MKDGDRGRAGASAGVALDAGGAATTRRGWTPVARAAAPSAACATPKGVDLRTEHYAELSHGKRIAQLFEDLAEERLWEPTFVIDYPVEISPLAKARADDPASSPIASSCSWPAWRSRTASPSSTTRWSSASASSTSSASARSGDDEAHRMDDDYVRALGHGLPPTGGCGVGIDRLAMILTDSPSIRDVILFPHMRPGGRPAT